MSDEATKPRGKRVLTILLLSVFTGIGALLTVAIVIDWLQAVDTYSWDSATCTIESSEVVEQVETGDYGFRVSYTWSHRGERFSGAEYRHSGSSFERIAEVERLVARYEAGRRVPCWVDPEEPADAYLVRANLWRGFWVLVPLVFCAVGAGSIWLVLRLGRDAERTSTEAATAVGKAKPVVGVGLLTAFFGLFFLFGVGFLVPFFVRPALQVMEARSWQPVPCEILSSGVVTHSGDDSDTYSVEALYRYEIDGREHRSNRYRFMGGSSGGYEAKAEAAARIPEGAEVTCWVDPEDPYEAVIERGFSTDYLFGLVPLLFALVGLGGMVVVVVGARSVKKSAAGPHWRPPPATPSGPVELEPASGPLGKLGCSIAVALLWNGLVSVFVWIFVKEWMAGSRDWFLALFLTPFVLIGLLLLAGIPYSILALANPRPRLKLDRSAIPAGESAQIAWSFTGWTSRLRGLRVWLECSRTTTETTQSESGVSTSTNTEVVDTIEIFERGPGRQLVSGTASFTVPEAAAPTAEGPAAIAWKLKLQGEIAWWPDVSEEYEIRVLP